MRPQRREAESSLTVLERVRCLDCGELYSKPTNGGTVRANPGCPKCGYLGWVAAPSEANAAAAPLRSAEGQQQRRSGRLR